MFSNPTQPTGTMNKQMHASQALPITKQSSYPGLNAPHPQKKCNDTPSQQVYPVVKPHEPYDISAPVRNEQHVLMHPGAAQDHPSRRSNPAIILTEATPSPLESLQPPVSQRQHEQLTLPQMYDLPFSHQAYEVQHPDSFLYRECHHPTPPSYHLISETHRYFDPSQPQPYHQHILPPHQAPCATYFQAVPRPKEDYQAMIQAMAVGNFSISIFGAAGEQFPHNIWRIPTRLAIKENGPVSNSGPVQQSLLSWAQTLATPAPRRRNRKKGGALLS